MSVIGVLIGGELESNCSLGVVQYLFGCFFFIVAGLVVIFLDVKKDIRDMKKDISDMKNDIVILCGISDKLATGFVTLSTQVTTFLTHFSGRP
jgi:undecaprenyl pyrophosphate phosphatase UppP